MQITDLEMPEMEEEHYSYDLRRLQLMQLDILKELVRVCDKHDFHFYIMNGTCLGAIRHKGFIPWDDDIDVGMYAEEFDKLIQCSDEFGEKYFLQTIETDSEFKTMIARIRLNGTTIIEKDYMDADIHHGVFIDIYPLFGYPANPVKAKIRSWESLLYRMLLSGDAPKNHGKAAKIIGTVTCGILPKKVQKSIADSIHKKLRSEPENTRYVAFLYGMDVHLFSTIRYERSWFGQPSYVQFEDIVLPAPTDYDSYLKIRYKNYMELPPKEKQNSYHSFEFVDLDHSYTEYKGKKYLIGKF